MAGTFAAWRLGTLQARALPFARELRKYGIDCAVVTVPWDMPSEAGVTDTISGIPLLNATATRLRSFPLAVTQQVHQVRSLQPRAVHVFKPKGYGGLAGRLLSSTIPLLIDSDDWEGDGGWNQAGNYTRLQRRLFDWQERSMLRDARAVTAASHLLVRRARTLRSAPADTVTWVPNGLEPTWAGQLSNARLASDAVVSNAPSIVLYSRFAEFSSNWLPRYLAALSSSMPANVTATVTIIGESEHVCAGFDNVVIEHMGYVARDQLPALLGRAHIAIYPYADTLIARAKNSVKLLELMTAGVAVIASRIGDAPAVAGDAAILLDTSEPEAFADATVALQRNSDMIRRLSFMARHRALDQFSIATVVRGLADAYHNAGVLPPCSNA